MKVTLSKENPPRKGDRLVHNGAVCIKTEDSWATFDAGKLDQVLYSELWWRGLEVERAEEPIVIVQEVKRSGEKFWESRPNSPYQDALNTLNVGETGYFKTTVERISESEYKQLKGEK